MMDVAKKVALVYQGVQTDMSFDPNSHALAVPVLVWAIDYCQDCVEVHCLCLGLEAKKLFDDISSYAEMRQRHVA